MRFSVVTLRTSSGRNQADLVPPSEKLLNHKDRCTPGGWEVLLHCVMPNICVKIVVLEHLASFI